MPARRAPLLALTAAAALAMTGCVQSAPTATSSSGLEVTAAIAEKRMYADTDREGCVVEFTATNTSDATIEWPARSVELQRNGELLTDMAIGQLYPRDRDPDELVEQYEVPQDFGPGEEASWVIGVPCDELEADGVELVVDDTAEPVSF